MNKPSENIPVLLRAVRIIVAKPTEVQREALQLKQRYAQKFGATHTESQICAKAIDKVISNYSYYSAFVGGATALTGVIPGLGTVIASFGGATADSALSMKFQIEMTMAIAAICGHNIEVEEEQRLCFIVAGLGAINEAAKEKGKQMGTQAFINMTRRYLQGSTLIVLKEVFQKVGLTFTRKAVEKSIPFGVGVVIGFSANKGFTYYIGRKAKSFFLIPDDPDNAETPIVDAEEQTIEVEGTQLDEGEID